MLAENSPPLMLTILRQGDRILIDLAEIGSLIPRSETRVDDAFLQELADEVQRLGWSGEAARHSGGGQQGLAEGAPGLIDHELQRIGGLIFSHLLPEPARIPPPYGRALYALPATGRAAALRALGAGL